MSYKDVTRPAPAEYRTNQCTHDDADKAPCPICERDAEIARLRNSVAFRNCARVVSRAERAEVAHDRLAVENGQLRALLNEAANALGPGHEGLCGAICALLGEGE